MTLLWVMTLGGTVATAGRHEQGDDAAIVPGVGRPAPLQGEKKAHNCRQEEESAKRVKTLDVSPDRGLWMILLGRVPEQYHEG
ncbi:hypothetical protein VTK73DRAFT_9840 [Phialemonium thermophilum]|uniref:Secreted protein n=1 Tax=Phialemonium thermophilum TaxID=223376 RepID=A0ABR3W031_9PEZI